MDDASDSPSDDDRGDDTGRDRSSGGTEERRGYGIGTVSRLTGISTHTLRVWERRYGAVDAERSESGRRLYARDDIERLTVMKHLVDRGEPIGHVARLSREALQERLQAYEQHVAMREQLASAPVRAAFLGDSFSEDFAARSENVNVVTRGSDLAAFRADIKRLRPEALILELPTVDAGTRGLVGDLRRLSSASRVVVVYSFARSHDIDALVDEWTDVLRAPVLPADLERVLRTVQPAARRNAPREDTRVPGGVHEMTGEIPPRRYSRAQLASMARQSTAVECECPRHLVDLVLSLTAFETYSAGCESRSPADAALHAYLHETTARARELIEEALQRVAEAEGIEADADAPE